VIGADDSVLIRVARSEMGQAARPAFHAGRGRARVRLEKSAHEFVSTGEQIRRESRLGVHGHRRSRSIRDSQETSSPGGRRRARDADRAAAAQRWKVPVSECDAEERRHHAHAVAEKAAFRPGGSRRLETRASKDVKLKDPKDWNLIGKAAHPAGHTRQGQGKPLFGIDVQLPGMAYAAIAQWPGVPRQARDRRGERIKGMRGLIKVVQLEDAVAVVADNWWRATACSRPGDRMGRRRERAGASTESIASSCASAGGFQHSGGAQRRQRRDGLLLCGQGDRGGVLRALS